MKKQFCTVIFSMILSILLLNSVFAATWPADSSGTELAGGLGVYEPSGAAWHSRLGQLFVVSDEGLISKMNSDGSSVTTWNIGGDLEGIAVADPNSNYIYVINEYPFALYQFDISSGTKTKTWSLTNVVPAPINQSLGLEGMTYIPSEDYSTSNGRGVFAVGSQETGTIYFLDIDTSTSGGSVTLLRSMTPAGAWISDLFYDRETNVLYVLYDSTLVEMSLQGTIAATYTVPGSDQEGVTLTTACSTTSTTTTATIYIASDTPASVKKYNNYPVNCPSNGSSGSGSTTKVWSASSSGTNVGSGLSSTFEPSGVFWNAAANKLVVVNDNGGVSTMNADGSSPTSWSLSGDLEGVSAQSSTAYVLNEYPFAIYTFSTASGIKTATWDLSNIGITTPSTTSNGLEGMAYIPDGDHSYGTTSFGGIFAVGSSDDGRIYFVGVSSSGSATLLGSMQPVAEAITDMFYSADTELLYVLYGTTLREMTLDGTVAATYTSVPGTDPEGFTFVPDCSAGTAVVYIANDVGNTVMKYSGYPITCTSSTSTTPVDTDADGLLDTEEATYGTNPNLADTDSDGLTDYQEVVTYGTNALAADTDSDGLTDYQEVVTYGTNALVADTDSDGLTDYQEVVTYGTNALAADTDGGSVNDGQEVTNGTNPLVASDDVPATIDPNLISSETISGATITVNYADGHVQQLTPYSTPTVQAAVNYDSTRLITSNGKYVSVYKNGVRMTRTTVTSYTPSTYTLSVTHGSSSDTVVVSYRRWDKLITVTYTLQNDVLTKVSTTSRKA